jgi:hypothetical protein
MYVSSHKDGATAGRVDVFSPEGDFITELASPGARSIAVDPKGNLFVNQFQPGVIGGLKRVTLYRPSAYDPEAEDVAYGNPGEVIIENEVGSQQCSAKSAIAGAYLAVDETTEHLFVSDGTGCVGEWSSAEEGPQLLDSTIGVGVLTARSKFLAVDHEHNRLYVSSVKDPNNPVEGLIQVFELEASHTHLGSLDGRTTANGKFLAHEGDDTIDVDEESGHLIVSELTSTPKVYELGLGLGTNEEVLNTYQYAGFKGVPSPLEVAVDNSTISPNHRTFYVPSIGHTFAFRFSGEGEPQVESVSATGVTESEAVLNASINPNGGTTKYRIDYTTQSSFEIEGFARAALATAGSLPAGIAGVQVSSPVIGLAPGTSYRFRVSAENEAGAVASEGSFRTYSSISLGGPCANGSLRAGFSAALPDCRAYELVTPSNTNGLIPRGAAETAGLYFPTLQASPDGSKATFRIEGGTIPGFEGSGSFNGDDYFSKRGADGWNIEIAGPGGTDALAPSPGGFSPDQEHSFWKSDTSPYIRYPDGHSEPVGRGSLGVDPGVEAKLIGQDAGHTIFASVAGASVKLEPDAPRAGTAAIYDRTGDERTHVVSLLPGNITPAAGENAKYLGTSLDGEGVGFEIGAIRNILYLRQNDAATYEVGTGLTYAGIVEGGGRIFYLESGNLFAFDTASKSAIQFSKGGDTTPVNISADGTTAYFLSPDVLTGNKRNPAGAIAQPGDENLFFSRQGQLSFVGTVEPLDVEETLPSGQTAAGLGLWVKSQREGRPAMETSRVTADGSVLLFQSRAPLTGYDTNGHTEIYRYDAAEPSLTCLSCNPTGIPATNEASLQTLQGQGGSPAVVGLATRILNIRPEDGFRAFFQSYEPLVASDADGKQDVYEWEAQGVGSCSGASGCVYLISSGQSDRDEHLFAVSKSGDDAFFLSGNQLVARDTSSTPSIYDARAGGGFAEEATPPGCQGEGCRGGLTPPPVIPSPATPALGKNGNVSQHCPKGKRKVKRHGKARCVKKHRRRHHRHHPAKNGSRR